MVTIIERPKIETTLIDKVIEWINGIVDNPIDNLMKGKRHHFDGCPIANTLKAATGEVCVVDHDHVHIGRHSFYPTSYEAQQFIRAFDRSEYPELQESE